MHASEARYRSLFHAIDSGFCIIELKFDEDQRPVDYRIVEGNAAFENLTGLHGSAGKWVSEAAPGLEAHWFELYGRVARTGEPARFENPADIFGRWYDVEALRIGPPEAHQVAILFKDITGRKQAEARQAALIELADAVAETDEPGRIIAESARILGQALGACRVGYGETDPEAGTIMIGGDWTAEGFGSVAGLHRYEDYGAYAPQLLAGDPVAISDVMTDPRTAADPGPLMAHGVRAFLDVPLVEKGRVVAQILVHAAAPRTWADGEIAFVRDFAERTRAAVTRREAEREKAASDRELRRLTDNLPLLVSFVDRDLRYVFNNGTYEAWFGITPDGLKGRTVLEVVGDAAFEAMRPQLEAALQGQRISFDQFAPYSRGGGRHIHVEYLPRTDEAGAVDGFYAMVQDITARRQAEMRQAVLLDLNDALRDLTDPAEIAHASSRILAEALNVSRVGYGVMDTEAETITIERDYNAPGVQSIAGVIHFRDFGSYIEDLARGEAVIFADAAEDSRVSDGGAALAGISATGLINLPLIERGKVVALLFVNNATPRPWSCEDVALVREVAERVRTATERARASVSLAESEARYRTLFETIDEGFCIIEFIDGPEGPLSDYVHVQANEAAAEQVGLDALRGRSLREIAGGEAQEWIDLYGEVLRTGRPIRFEKEFRETGRWLELAAFRVEPAGRNQVAVLFKDLTVRRQAELAVRESEARFRNIADYTPMMMWVTDAAGWCTYLNRTWYEFTGQTEGEAEGYGWLDATHPDDKARAEEAFVEANAARAPFRVEYRLRRADGVYRWAIDAASPRFDASGEFLGYVGSVIDIEERREVEDALRASEAQFRAFAQAVPNHVWASRPDGHLYWFNNQVYAYVGLPAGALDGPAGWGGVVHPEDLPNAAEAWSVSLSSGEPYETMFRIRRADGAWRWFTVRAEPVRDETGQIARWVGANIDVDDAQRQQVELARFNDRLEEQVAARTRELEAAHEALRQSQKMEAVGQLTGGIAHDFNNLLAGISGSLELLEKRIGEGRLTGVDRYISAAQGAAQRAAALTQRLLAFSRRQTLDPKPVNVNRLIAGMEDLIRRSVGPNVEVEVVGAGGLWATRMDPSQLENALLNLCINGRDAMSPGGGRLTIETANKWLDERAARGRDLPPGQYVSLCVTDTGTGMTPEVISQAFDPFFTTKPLGQGTGLGLSMIHGFVRQSGGQVRIYSEVGKGTTMCLYLPRYMGEVDEDSVAVGYLTGVEGHGETVLVIDDEPTVRMLIVEVLEDAGYRALQAGDGPSGLALLRAHPHVDLLITDVGLPGGMNGRQVADAARQTRPDLKVLFVTGYAENAAVGNGLLDPGMEVMTKPFIMAELGEKIRDMIERPGPG